MDNAVITTSDFKQWFATSKVTGPDGAPLVVYHGSPRSFTAFDPATMGTLTDEGEWGRGFYFSNDREYAEQYADDGDGNTGHVYAVYLSLQNPFIVDYTVDDFRMPDRYLVGYTEFGDLLKEDGYDGVIILGTRTPDTNEYVAFYPEQIKLCTEA